jgi:hypothetical protein
MAPFPPFPWLSLVELSLSEVKFDKWPSAQLVIAGTQILDESLLVSILLQSPIASNVSSQERSGLEPAGQFQPECHSELPSQPAPGRREKAEPTIPSSARPKRHPPQPPMPDPGRPSESNEWYDPASWSMPWELVCQQGLRCITNVLGNGNGG